MLSTLHIENVAVIERADLELDSGLNVLTGETGAGKSILIDSINMVLGERVSRDIVRNGADKAHVSALFTGISPASASVIASLGYEPDEDGGLLFQRDITADGKSTCRISGRVSTVSILREAGRLLVNTHGQHDNQALLSPEKHLAYLDSYAGLGEKLSDYRGLYAEMSRLRREIDKLTTDEGEKARRLDLLAYQADEIEKAALQPGEDEELHARRSRYMNAEKISQAVGEAYASLEGSDEYDSGAVALLSAASESLSGIADVYPDIGELSGRMTDLRYEAEECLNDLRAFTGDVEVDPAEMEYIEQRLDTIFRLKKKYGASIEEINAFGEKAKAEMETLESSDARIAQLKEQYREARKKAQESADGIGRLRREAAKDMENKIRGELTFLDMPEVEFSVRFEPAGELTANGADRVEFLICANPGSLPKPLVKIASGGELSRIMLAIKNVLADKDDIETSIFDEIDTGVSGRAAHKIGLKLKQVARGRQVICVTHLAQIAAQADRHILIEKKIAGGSTRTALHVLGFEGRKKELARIIGGADITSLTLQNAEEMLLSAGVRK